MALDDTTLVSNRDDTRDLMRFDAQRTVWHTSTRNERLLEYGAMALGAVALASYVLCGADYIGQSGESSLQSVMTHAACYSLVGAAGLMVGVCVSKSRRIRRVDAEYRDRS